MGAIHPGVDHRHPHLSTRWPPRPQLLRLQRYQMPLVYGFRIVQVVAVHSDQERSSDRQHPRIGFVASRYLFHRPAAQYNVLQHQAPINQPQNLDHVLQGLHIFNLRAFHGVDKGIHHLAQPNQIHPRRRGGNQRIEPPIPIRGNRLEGCLPILLD